MRTVALKAFAKINLSLRVIGRREDGYHELRTIYQTISLADRVEVSLGGRGDGVELEASGIEVPAGGENLAVRAAEAIRRETGFRGSVVIRLRKRIPTGGGMGGASSDAVAVMRALLLLTKKKVSVARLLHVAAGLGSDVPFFLLGGTALGVGRGEEVYPLPETGRRHCVVALPEEGVATPGAFARLRAPALTVPGGGPKIESFCGAVMQEAMAGEGLGIGAGASAEGENDFEPQVLERFPELRRARARLLRQGAIKVQVTGSGSAFYGLFRERAAARAAAEGLDGLGLRVLLARTISRREYRAAWSAANTSQ